MGPCERCNIFRTASGGVTMTDSNRMLPACPQPITGKPLLSVQLVMKCRQPLACCATGTCAKRHVKNLHWAISLHLQLCPRKMNFLLSIGPATIQKVHIKNLSVQFSVHKNAPKFYFTRKRRFCKSCYVFLYLSPNNFLSTEKINLLVSTI